MDKFSSQNKLLTSSVFLSTSRQVYIKLTKIVILCTAVVLLGFGINVSHAENRVTILYDAFGKSPDLKKDWGFSALLEFNGKRILFDTGNDSAIFEHNVKTKGIDLTSLDFAIISHRHGDHIGGLNYLLKVNPEVKVYAPEEGFGVFGYSLPGTFYRQNSSLPPDHRYFGGNPPEVLHFGTAWPRKKFNLVAESIEVAPGIHLLVLPGTWGTNPPVVELSLAIDTPEGVVLVVGCSHPTIEKIVETTRTIINKPIHLLIGGTHLLPASDKEIQRIATELRDTWKVAWIAPAHCTGEPAFAILKETFGDRYLYAGLGTTISLGSDPLAGAEDNTAYVYLDKTELQTYRALSIAEAEHEHDNHEVIVNLVR